ncbi:MAG: hypothetical protein ACOCXT_03205 [Candidatus Dojkabacteria bacterium]
MKNEISVIMYPKEYFGAMIYWTIKISELQSITLENAMLDYSDLYGSLTEEP